MLASCSSQNNSLRYSEEIYDIVNVQLNEFNDVNLFYKSSSGNQMVISDDKGIFKCKLDDGNLKEARRKKDSVISLDINQVKKKKLLNFIEQKYVQLKTSEFLTQVDINKMTNSLKQKPIKWDKRRINNRITNKKLDNDVSLSIPALNSNGTIALVYVKSNNYYVANFFKKDQTSWSLFCYFPIALFD